VTSAFVFHAYSFWSCLVSTAACHFLFLDEKKVTKESSGMITSHSVPLLSCSATVASALVFHAYSFEAAQLQLQNVTFFV